MFISLTFSPSPCLLLFVCLSVSFFLFIDKHVSQCVNCLTSGQGSLRNVKGGALRGRLGSAPCRGLSTHDLLRKDAKTKLYTDTRRPPKCRPRDRGGRQDPFHSTRPFRDLPFLGSLFVPLLHRSRLGDTILNAETADASL